MYSISILHQTTTAHLVTRNTFLLYSISILHQTTTIGGIERPTISCILFQFYIKPQLFSRNFFRGFRCILFQFYIKPQPRRIGTASGIRHFPSQSLQHLSVGRRYYGALSPVRRRNRIWFVYKRQNAADERDQKRTAQNFVCRYEFRKSNSAARCRADLYFCIVGQMFRRNGEKALLPVIGITRDV